MRRWLGKLDHVVLCTTSRQTEQNTCESQLLKIWKEIQATGLGEERWLSKKKFFFATHRFMNGDVGIFVA